MSTRHRYCIKKIKTGEIFESDEFMKIINCMTTWIDSGEKEINFYTYFDEIENYIINKQLSFNVAKPKGFEIEVFDRYGTKTEKKIKVNKILSEPIDIKLFDESSMKNQTFCQILLDLKNINSYSKFDQLIGNLYVIAIRYDTRILYYKIFTSCKERDQFIKNKKFLPEPSVMDGFGEKYNIVHIKTYNINADNEKINGIEISDIFIPL
jgi:hypothetical protein